MVTDELSFLLVICDGFTFFILLSPALSVLCHARVQKLPFVIYILSFWVYSFASATNFTIFLYYYLFWPDCKLNCNSFPNGIFSFVKNGFSLVIFLFSYAQWLPYFLLCHVLFYCFTLFYFILFITNFGQDFCNIKL